MPPGSLPPQIRARGVTAVLGPTNTGKTHLAIERMLAHSSGIIGLPLRLLAREVYTRIVEKAGKDSVSLITGEERIRPKTARFHVATTEAMPPGLDTAFVAIDEAQLGADADRGHIFTDAILNRRGREETLIIGAGTLKPLIEQLLPGAHIVSRPRLSKLSFAGEKKISRLARRSAIVAFSAEEVYAIAELMRRQRGGAAVVLGALSPRTRNAQVELYQNGDVEHIVATDAIGMGLNLDIDHVAFAGGRKFDGHRHRMLYPAEFGQIAGRAGRHLRDGSFGTSGRCEPFDQELAAALENHTFEPLRVLNWRNPALDFNSLQRLADSLGLLPDVPGLARAPKAEDEHTFDIATSRRDVRAMAASRDGVKRLWELCQLPDYRKVAPQHHADLVVTLYEYIMLQGSIPEDWFAREVASCDRPEGDIETLSARLAQIRTWTFCANRDWLKRPEHWQNAARAIEDKLSDALHERLTQRFVDRRTSVLMRRLRENRMLEALVTSSGDVLVEGQHVGTLQGFRFAADPLAEGVDAKALEATAQRALGLEIEARAARLSAAPDDVFALALDGTLRWIGEPVGKLVAGDKVLEPRVAVLADEQLTGPSREKVEARLGLWIKAHVQKLLGPLLALDAGEGLEGIARGIAFQAAENLGVLDRQQVAQDIKTLDQPGRAALRMAGIRFGAYHLYLPLLLKPAPRTLAAQLHMLKHGGIERDNLDTISHLASSGRTSIPFDEKAPKTLYRIAGYRVAGARAIRVDILERLADQIRPALAYKHGLSTGEPPPGACAGGGFTITVGMTSLVGCSGEEFGAILKNLGYRMEKRPAPAVKTADAGAAAPAATPAPAPQPVAAPAPAKLDSAEPELPFDFPVQPAPPAAAAAAPEAAFAPEAAAAAAAEPAMIEVWRPSRFERGERPQHSRAAGRAGRQSEAGAAAADGQKPESLGPDGKPWRNRSRRSQVKPGDTAVPAGDASAAPGAAADAAAPKRFERPARRPNRPDFKGRDSDSSQTSSSQPSGDTGGKPRFTDKPRSDGKPRFDGKPRSDGKPRFDGKPRHGDRPRPGNDKPREWTAEAPRGKGPDPDSPFAKLMELKQRLEADKAKS